MTTTPAYSAILKLLVIAACSKDNEPGPTEPEPSLFPVVGYGETIDSLYLKVWSDSSAEWFHKTQLMNGVTYVVTMNRDSFQYFYTDAGYSGFQPPEESPIIFDSPLGYLPTEMEIDREYERSTSFFYAGFVYTMRQLTMLTDTGTISVPVGRFDSCISLSTRVIFFATGYSEDLNSTSWLAKGPGGIRVTQSNGLTIEFAWGYVNGRSWGSGSNMPVKKSPSVDPYFHERVWQRFLAPLVSVR